ncbi:YjiH family protein [Corynebacterium macginleyi]|uniref:YjiH family protein n=1 Tax=Corynebacterium macginleyi TaxID=38290 RepID=UPI000EF98C9C|nr:YjiH family protein [Corynebacterium macginleyi]MBK4160698.1 YjiH family protein [Corynebacterium macginleyi]MBK4179343.1 YjiH family protein [Corynebacterium macginleyi]MBK4183488.1 YjiH family protein [Corynebacterium macginleyi]QRP20599.1 YjiH family protein [Corynebacterium macginleyi]RMB67580.1 YjiH family protein [Corynebacterium macginleyi]
MTSTESVNSSLQSHDGEVPRPGGRWKLFVYSAIGAFVFFFPVTYKGKNSIPLDHIVTIVRDSIPAVVPWLIFALSVYGTVRSFSTGAFKQSALQAVFAVLNIAGAVISFLMVIDALPWFLGDEDLVPFLWNSIATPVGLIVPIGGTFLAFLIGFGLLEFVGVLMQPIMRPLWKTPGRSAIDAVASFVGSYSLGILVTDRVYQKGGYTGREAAVIATGFSTVSAAFMVIVAKQLDLMNIWGTYFAVTLVVTFLVTAITVRIPPLRMIPDEYCEDAEPDPEKPVEGSRFKNAWREAMLALQRAPSLPQAVWDNLRDGVRMAAAIVPSIMSVGLIGLLLARFTPVFEWIGYLFYPFARIVQLPEPELGGKAAAMGIAEMFLPATAVAGSDSMVLKFVIGVVAVSAIIFFSALVPCILATKIPVKLSHLVIIWFERVALTIVIATPIAHLLF